MKQPPKLPAHTVKDAMVRREVEHLRAMGTTPVMTEVDSYATERLEKAAAQNAEARLKALARRQRKQRQQSSTIAEQEASQAGYRFRQRAAGPKPSGPKFVSVCSCGGCIQCRRELRMKEILRLGLAGDERLHALAWALVLVGMRAQAQAGEFKDVALGLDRARVVTREIEDINDRSIPVLGEWR